MLWRLKVKMVNLKTNFFSSNSNIYLDGKIKFWAYITLPNFKTDHSVLISIYFSRKFPPTLNKSWPITPRGLELFPQGKFSLLQHSDILPLAQATICWKLWSYLGILAKMCWNLRPHWRKQARPSNPHKPMESSSGNGEDTLEKVKLPIFTYEKVQPVGLIWFFCNWLI